MKLLGRALSLALFASGTYLGALSVPARAEAPAGEPVEIVPTTGHAAGISSIDIASDRNLILSVDADETLKLWDLTSGRLIRTIRSPVPLLSGAIREDGRSAIARGYKDNSLFQWDLATGQLQRAFKRERRHYLSFSARHDEALVYDEAEAKLSIVDLSSDQVISTLDKIAWDSSAFAPAAFSPDGRSVLVATKYGPLVLFSVAPERLVRTFAGYADKPSTITFSADGKTVLTIDGNQKIATVWDVTTGKSIRTFKSDVILWTAALSPDGRTAWLGRDNGDLTAWDVSSGKAIRTWAAQARAIKALTVSRDGLTIISGGEDGNAAGGRGDFSLNLWNTASGAPVQRFTGRPSTAQAFAVTPDGRTALLGMTDTLVRQIDLTTGRLVRTLPGHTEAVTAVAITPDGRTGLSGSGDQTLRLWDLASGRTGQILGSDLGQVHSIAVSSDGRTVLSGHDIDKISLWDVASGKVLHHLNASQGDDDSNAFMSDDGFAFSPDSRTALSADSRGRIRFWDVASGRMTRILSTQHALVASLAMSPDGEAVLMSGDTYTVVVNLSTGEIPTSLDGGHAAFAPDSPSVLVSHWNTTTLTLHDLASGRTLQTFGTAAVRSQGGFLPNGRGVWGFGSDGSLRIWKSETGEVLASLYVSPDGEWVTVTPEGFFDASDHGADILGVVQGLQVSSLGQLYQALHRPDLVAEKLAGDPQGKVAAAAAKLDLGKVAASGGAPRVSLLTPADGTKTEADHVDLEARIDDAGGGIGRVEWRINGAVLGVEERGLVRLSGATPADRFVTAHRRVSLSAGDNAVEVVAYNAQNLVASTPIRITITSTQRQVGKPKLYVLAVGINAYWDSRIDLSFAAPDATAFAEAFKQAGRTLYDAVETTTVLDADATAANLDKVFADLAAKVRPQDVFVFFYAGHGKTIDARFYMVPQDLRYSGDASIVAQGIGQDRFQRWLASIPARKSMLLFDACESGSLTADAARGLGRVEEQYTALDRMTQATGRTILTASTDDKPALEGYKGHGVFTYALLDGLAKAQAHSDGLIYMNELVSFVEDDVPDISFKAFKTRQIPQTKTVGTNFPLVSRTQVLADGGTEAAPQLDVAPKAESYVVIALTPVRQAAEEGSTVTTSLPAGSQVDVIQTSGGWSLVARSGKPLGYVDEKLLVRLQ